MPPLDDAQLTERQHYLGGTDMAALAGVSRWGTPVSVFSDKRPDVLPPPARSTSPMMALGHLLEPVVAGLITEATGLTLRQAPLHLSPWVPPYKTRAIQCPDHPWEGANVDRMTAMGLIECKWGESRRRWGDMTADRSVPWVDHPPAQPPTIPPDYYTQVQHYLHVTRRAWAVVGVLLGYADFRTYTIMADPDLQGALVTMGEQFWRDHALTGLVPAPDGSDQYEARLRARWARDDGQQRPATPAEVTTLQAIRAAQETKEVAAKEEARLRQVLMDSMAGTTRIDGPAVSVTWRQNKPTVTTTTDWPAVVDDVTALLAPSRQARVGGIVASRTATTTKDGARPLRITYSDDEE